MTISSKVTTAAVAALAAAYLDAKYLLSYDFHVIKSVVGGAKKYAPEIQC